MINVFTQGSPMSIAEIDFSEIRSTLYSAVLSDVLDGLGRRHQALAPNIRPLDDSLVMVGRARTGNYMPVFDTGDPGENPMKLKSP